MKNKVGRKNMTLDIDRMIDFVVAEGGHDERLARYVNPSEFVGHPLWSGRFVKERPQIISKVLSDSILAGTDMIFTFTYQTTVNNLQQHYNISKEEALDIIKRSVTLCKEAIDDERRRGLLREVSIVGVIGPYGAVLHDGSEYSGGNYVDNMSEAELVEWHKPRLDALVEAGCDYLIFATIPSLKEAEALICLLKQHPGMKAIVSFSAQNELTVSHGEKLSDTAGRCWQLAADQILAIGVNCLHPRLVEPLLQSIKDANPDIPLFVKTNTTEVFNKQTKEWEPSNDPRTLREYCRDWLKLEVKYIGGCCRTSEQDVTDFIDEIHRFTNKIYVYKRL